VLFGGFTPAALARVARWGDGFLCATPPAVADDLPRTIARYYGTSEYTEHVLDAWLTTPLPCSQARTGPSRPPSPA
jgi:alkanesulfonate monooxygenase SsuD/methylene tetrahydromethanopterin reductase-like flavin-dependent oxidoreductase (luciferase family)